MGEMEFVVAVVLDDAEVVALGQRQQLQPPLGRHHHRGRKLVMRRQIHRLYRVAAAQRRQRVGPHAVIVHIHVQARRPLGTEGRARRRIAEPVQRHRVAGTEQGLAGQVDAHDAAAGQADIVQPGAQPPLHRQHVQQGAPQAGLAARISVRQPAGAGGGHQRAAVGAAQHVEGNQPRIGHVLGKIDHILRRVLACGVAGRRQRPARGLAQRRRQ
ncbi:hypothetical protein DK842_08140 [Chromobacterium phragmitis]|nr:hypothetical protein [Chromobacterium phragmitis]AXE29862.1 hypothetical protein DK842_08140 [Chromobacterium phragmitis]